MHEGARKARACRSSPNTSLSAPAQARVQLTNGIGVLNGSVVRNRSQSDGGVGLGGNGVGFAGSDRQSLQLNFLSLLLGLLFQSGIFFYSSQEVITAFRVFDVLDSQVDTLFEITVANNLVDDYSDGSGSNVVHDTSAAVVVFVGHTLLLGTVGFDVDNVPNSVYLQESRELDLTSLFEATLEHVASATAVTERVRHGGRRLSVRR